MKKTILAILMTMMTTTAFAEGKCEGGDPFEGVSDGHEYCISTTTMNWWSAFAWCQHQGRHLASLQEACEGWHATTGSTICGNFVTSDFTRKYLWMANPSGSTNAYHVIGGSGNIVNLHTYGRAAGFFALCY